MIEHQVATYIRTLLLVTYKNLMTDMPLDNSGP